MVGETQLFVTNHATHLCNVQWRLLLKTLPPYMCYHAKFGRSRSKGVNIEMNPKIGERWGSRSRG